MASSAGRSASRLRFRLIECPSDPVVVGHMRMRMLAFERSLATPFDMEAEIVDAFNTRLRHLFLAYRKLGPIRSIDELPLIRKSSVLNNLQAFMLGANATSESWIKCTSGTTGPPLTIRYGNLFHLATVLLTVPRIATRLSLKPNSRSILYSLTLRDRSEAEPILRIDTSGYSGAAARVCVDTTRDDFAGHAGELIRMLSPFALSSTPDIFQCLVERLRPAQARGFNVGLVISGGAHLSNELRAELGQLFQAPVCSAYGLSEVGIVASECAAGQMHLDTSACFMSTIPATTGTEPNADLEELVVSSVHNPIMPFLRYGTGDLARLTRSRCACGECSPVIADLLGQVAVLFRRPDGSPFASSSFRDAVSVFPWLKEFQVTQEHTKRIRVRFETKDGFDPEPSRLAALNDYFRSASCGAAIVLQREPIQTGLAFKRFCSLVDG